MTAPGIRLLMGAGGGVPQLEYFTNLEGWWDFSDAATVTLASGLVSALADKSGNNNHMDDHISGVRPPAPTGSPARSAFSASRLDCNPMTTSNVWANRALTLVMVRDGFGNGWFSLHSTAFSNEDHQFFTYHIPSGGNMDVVYGDGAAFSGVGDLLSQRYTGETADSALRVASIRISTSAVSVRLNGAAQTLTPSFSMPQSNFLAATPGTLQARLGGRLHTTQQTSGAQYGEALLYAEYVSDSNLAGIEAYAMAKWGI